jgi:hypothetical protein
MDRFTWNTKFTTEFIDQFGNKIAFYPLHNKTEGSMITTMADGFSLGGTYYIKEENDNFYLGWYSTEFLFRQSEKGFDLLVGKTVSYSFTLVK